MNDQELLTYAAKAIDLKWLSYHHLKGLCCRDDKYGGLIEYYWNPLKNDADAFQLTVKLGMMVDARYTNCVSKRYNRVVYWDNPMAGKEIEFGDAEMDEYALARRAIVMAAAEIGKGM